MSTIRIITLDQVRGIATRIADPSRVAPIIVVTSGDRGFNFDIPAIVDELGRNAVVYSCDHAALVAALEKEVDRDLVAGPGVAAIFGAVSLGESGFCVSYAPQVDTPNGIRRATGRVIGEARTMAYNAGLFDRPSEASVRVTCVVKRIFAGSAMLQPEPVRGVALPPFMSLLESTTYPGVPLSWYLSVGQVVTGVWDPESRNFVLDKSDWTLDDLAARYPYDSVTLAMITEVKRQEATLVVHPSLPITITKSEITSNPLDVIDRLFSVDDIVRVRVYRDAQGRTRLRLDDIDDTEETLPAMSLVPGGNPWLEQEHNAILDRILDDIESSFHVTADESSRFDADITELGAAVDIDSMLTAVSSVAGESMTDTGPLPSLPAGGAGFPGPVDTRTPIPGPGKVTVPASAVAGSAYSAPVAGSMRADQFHLNQYAMKKLRLESVAHKQKLESIQEQHRSALAELATAGETINLLKAERKELRAKLAAMRTQANEKGRETSTIANRRARFATADDWVREEMRRTWLSMYTPADRVQHNLETERWKMAPGFADSFAALDHGEQRKALRVLVNIVTRRNARENINVEHPLRESDGATAPEVTRKNGDACWRVHLENGVAQAKRLHYWRCRDGYFELSNIGDHDHFEP